MFLTSPFRFPLTIACLFSLVSVCHTCLAGVDRGSALQNYLGGSTTIVPLDDGRKRQDICGVEDLTCNFNGDPCRWGGEKKSDNSWFLASGTPDTTSWTAATGTPSTPDAPYAVVPVLSGVDSDWLVSDTISCQKDSVGVVTFDYWLTGSSKLKVCAVTDDSTLTEISCSDWITQSSPGPSSPGPMSISINGPIDKKFRLAIKPNGGSTAFGFVAVDNILYSASEVCSTCYTTTEAPTTSAPLTFPGILGGGVTTDPWPDHRKGTAIDNSNDISCGFDNSKPCRYGSDGSHSKSWVLVNGQPDPTEWKSRTGSSSLPTSPFLAIDLRGPGEPDWLLSDPIKCQSSGTVTYRLWLTSDATLKVCAVTPDEKHSIISCSAEHAQKETPGPITDTIKGPINTPFLLAFIPQGNGYAAVESINYVGKGICPGGGVTPAPTPGPFCNSLPCNFNAGSCGYTLKGQGATLPFEITNGKNPRVGCAENTRVIPDFSTGASFVGANVTQGSKAVLESPSVIPTSVTTLAARIYMATYGGEIDICTGYDGGKHTGCQILTGTKDFTAANYGWKSVSLTLPAKTSKIFIVVTHQFSQNTCAGIAIDNIEIKNGCK